MTCERSGCENEARYHAVDRRKLCALCAMGLLAVRESDIPALLEAAREMLDELEGSPILPETRATIRGILGR